MNWARLILDGLIGSLLFNAVAILGFLLVPQAYGYKLFDILVQDQYIVISRKYYVRFYPETKTCKSWNDRSFNTKNQVIRLIAFPFISALLAWICTML